MKGRKRGLSLILTLSLILSLVGPLPARAAGAVYSPNVAGVYLLPKEAADDSSFVRTNVLTTDGLLVNGHFGSLVESFLSVSGGEKSQLSPGNTYMHSENEKWSAAYSWNMTGMDTLQSLIAAKQVTINVSAALTADKHMHVGRHSTLTDRARLQVQYTADGKQKTTLTLQNGQDDPDEVARTYTGSKTLPAAAQNGLSIVMDGADCACGSSKVSKTYVYFSDLTAPTVSQVYVSDNEGNEAARTAYKAGETAYITLEMSEPIRFADGAAHDLTLTLDLLDSNSGQSTDETITADLVSLTGNKLVFSYTVAAGMDHFVTSVAPQAWANQETTLKLLGEQGQVLDISGLTADGLVTDLAGNPLSWTSGQMLKSRLVLDNDAPGYTRLNAQGNMTQGYKVGTDGEWPSDITPSATYAGVGDYLSFTLTLDEEVGLWENGVYSPLEANDVKAVLNVIKDGSPVTLTLAEVSYAPDGVTATRNSTFLTWSYFRPEAGMTMEAGEENQPIRILRLEAADGSSTLGDPAGNMLSLPSGIPTPAEKLKLDVTAPTVELDKNNTKISDSNYITVPFTIADEMGGSGVDLEQEVTVSLQISCDGTLFYCIDTNADAPNSLDDCYTWLDKFPLPASDSGNYYLHIYAARLGNHADPSTGELPIGVSITAQDYAGNQGTGSLGEYSVKTDDTGPAITLPETFSVSGEGQISVPFTVSDGSYLQSITIQWDGGSTEQVSLGTTSSATYSGAAILGGLSGSNSATLKVTATDVAGNVATAQYTYQYNMDPSARYTLKSPPGVVTGNPGLTLYAPARVGNASTGTDMTTLAVLQGSSTSLIYSISSSGSSFEIFSTGNQSRVCASCLEVAVEEGAVKIENYRPSPSIDWDPVYTYGDIKVTLVTLPTDKWDAIRSAAAGEAGETASYYDVTISDTTNYLAVEQFTIKAAQAFDKDATGTTNNAQGIYTIEFQTPKDAEGQNVSNAIASNVTGSTVSVQTLTGLTVPITISRAMYNDGDYRLNDIDYAASYVCLQYGSGTEVPGGRYYFSKALLGDSAATTWTLNYPITVSLAGERGTFTPVLHLVYLDGAVWEQSGSQLYMDDWPTGEFGPAEFQLPFGSVQMDADTTQVTLGINNNSWPITVFFDSFPLVTIDGTPRDADLEIWNPAWGDTPYVYSSGNTSGAPVYIMGYPDLDFDDPSSAIYLEGSGESTENTLCYRAILANGTYSPTKTLTVIVSQKDPAFDVTFTPGTDGGRLELTEVSDYAKEVLAFNGRTLRVSANDTFPAGETKSITLDSNLGLDLPLEELCGGWAGTRYLMLMDDDGNNAVCSVDVQQVMDIAPPVVTYSNGSVQDGVFTLRATVDDSGNGLSSGLNLGSISLEFAYSDNTTQTVALPALTLNGTWTGSGADYGGIYRIVENDGGSGGQSDRIQLLICGQLPYGTSGTVGVTLTCRDNMGYESAAGSGWSFDGTYTATKPTITAGASSNGQVSVTADLPIRVLDPVPAEGSGLGTQFTLPIYTDTATIQFEDVYGQTYTQEISVSPFEDLSVTLSETAATRGPVTLTATASGEAAITAISSVNNGSGAVSGSTATLELNTNDTVTITLSDETTHTVQVTNIDDKVEAITVAFYDENGILLSGNYVSGPVTAALQCCEPLVGQTNYTFPIGSLQGSTYTFQVTDLLGNAAEITANLPWTLVNENGEAEPPEDNTPPAYTVSLYAQRAGGWTQLNSYDSQITTGALSPSGLTADLPNQPGQAIRLAFSIRDDSPVNLIVKSGNGAVPGYNDASDSISGLTVTGSTLTWEGGTGTTAYVYLVDSQGNAADALELTFPAVDKTPPTATVEYVSEGSSLSEPPVRAYLVPNSNDASDFTVLDTGNLTLDEDEMSSHKGQYYYNFTTNGSYTFRFSDAAGNVATVTATVHSIDTTEPEVGSIQWLNRSISYTDAAWETAQSSLHTNAPVTAILTLNTQLKGVTVQGGTTDVTTSFMANQAQVTFSANTGEVKLTLTARNGQTTEITLDAVTCIDTAAPGVTVSGDDVISSGSNTYTVNGTDKRSVELTFTTDEATAGDLTTAENSTDGKFRTTHTYTASRNGEVTLTFTDRAGNVTQVTLNIQDLDDKLALSYSKNADGSDAVTDPADLELQTEDIFYVKSTRDADITLGTASSVSVTKGEWRAFTLPSTSGLVVLKAEDADENTLYAYLTVELPDTIPPVISLPSQTIYLQTDKYNADTGMDELRKGVNATDNGGDVTYSVTATGVNWDTPGTYTVSYTATDDANNETTVTRTLVLTREAPIALTVNGQTVYQGSTLTLSKGTASLTLQGVDTPVYLALKQGYKTVAQMKLNAQVLLNGSYTGAMAANLSTTGFYTLYLRTQDRTEYVFYLYVKG